MDGPEEISVCLILSFVSVRLPKIQGDGVCARFDHGLQILHARYPASRAASRVLKVAVQFLLLK